MRVPQGGGSIGNHMLNRTGSAGGIDKTSPCARAEEQSQTTPAGDSVQISDAARSAAEAKNYADIVKQLPDIRENEVERASQQLNSGSLLTEKAYRGATRAMLAAGVV